MDFRNLALAALLAVITAPVQAAFISIDDSDIDTITITAGDFEGGLSVNGVELTRGLSDRGSITLADSQEITLSGSWIDLGRSSSDFSGYFGNGGRIQSGIIGAAETDGFSGSIRALFIGYGPENNFGPAISLIAQDGSRFGFSQPFLSASFISEVAAVPAPAPLGLLALGLLALRRRLR